MSLSILVVTMCVHRGSLPILVLGTIPIIVPIVILSPAVTPGRAGDYLFPGVWVYFEESPSSVSDTVLLSTWL